MTAKQMQALVQGALVEARVADGRWVPVEFVRIVKAGNKAAVTDDANGECYACTPDELRFAQPQTLGAAVGAAWHKVIDAEVLKECPADSHCGRELVALCGHADAMGTALRSALGARDAKRYEGALEEMVRKCADVTWFG